MAGLDKGLEPRPGEGLLPFWGEWGGGVGLGGLTPPNGFLLPGDRMLDIIMAKGGAIEGGPGDRCGFRLLGEVDKRELAPEVKSATKQGPMRIKISTGLWRNLKL